MPKSGINKNRVVFNLGNFWCRPDLEVIFFWSVHAAALPLC